MAWMSSISSISHEVQGHHWTLKCVEPVDVEAGQLSYISYEVTCLKRFYYTQSKTPYKKLKFGKKSNFNA